MIYFNKVMRAVKKMEEYDACVSDILPPSTDTGEAFLLFYYGNFNVIKTGRYSACVSHIYYRSPYRPWVGFFIAFLRGYNYEICT